MKTALLAITLLLSIAFSGTAFAKQKGRNPAASGDHDCLGAENPDQAYLGRVEAALVTAKLKTVPRTEIVKTVTSVHDPEYEVTYANGKKVHVTCDDSGDAQCDCEVDK